MDTISSAPPPSSESTLNSIITSSLNPIQTTSDSSNGNIKVIDSSNSIDDLTSTSITCNTTTDTITKTTTTTTTTGKTIEETIIKTEENITIKTKWNGKEYKVLINKSSTVFELKRQLETMTNVLSKRQKILGLSKGKQPTDDMVIGTLSIQDGHSVIMMGTPESNIIAETPKDIDDEVFNDFEFDYIPDSDEISHIEKNKIQLNEMKLRCGDISLINEPRPNKKLLVLDLDHTILDFKDQDVENMKRPHLEEFLVQSYQNYDIGIWSQTSWKWIEIKLTELGLLTNPKFKICFVMDQTLMFKVTSYRNVNGKERTKIKHQVKALEIIWTHKHLGKFFTSKNTLHVDDLSKNFAMNPKNGVHVPPFKIKDAKKYGDSVLFHLTKYLNNISSEEDFTKIDHKEWIRKIL
ncbi:hypothetical protein DICPUDRAFT_157806 [Dictyostelium purpureum]|uniref:protein-serine/threonine phosphatase n=1 Tax=Dictyostelium purpureum TaxID=5786 RepID=F1A020_DICPU|nr:uncharacterized protein DICPUDRAFT_157806 [Dictyostelium purpureum]EGC30465.1 hypothetical protein DICPUDRAFT_157806 [Dictyostelium purpureum]|eukprot:XP_003293020.1 hypothetical protein DICPUDRAFT_157806 [Dictyostelium purpureum]